MTKDIERTDSWERAERERDIRQGIDLATTLERIEKNFVITDPRLPDNPIVSLKVVLSFLVHMQVKVQCCFWRLFIHSFVVILIEWFDLRFIEFQCIVVHDLVPLHVTSFTRSRLVVIMTVPVR